MAGVNLIRRGHIWRVGNGEKINIWKDAWIPQSPTKKVLTNRGSHLLSRVSDLIDPATGDWDVQLLHQTFWQIDVQRILAIPLPMHEMIDFVAWSHTKTGLFSVRSAYHCEWEYQYGNKLINENISDNSIPNGIWDTVWSLQCPAKVKIFVWRALHGAIPCRAVLADRHMKVQAHCPACNGSADTIKHLLFECSQAKDLWRLLGVEDVISNACQIDHAGPAVLEFLLNIPGHEVLVLGQGRFKEIIVVSSWYLWWERRKLNHEEETQSVYNIFLSVKALTANFTIAASPKAKLRTEGWMKPRRNYVKLNIDAAFDADSLQGAVGAVLRDSSGKFIAAANEKLDVCHDAFTAEAISLRFGLNLARNTGCNRLQINSDNMDVITTMQAGSSSSVASAIFEDCYFMSMDFSHVIYEHCFREANLVAHELARWARFSPPSVWVDSAPVDLVPFLVKDATIVMNE